MSSPVVEAIGLVKRFATGSTWRHWSRRARSRELVAVDQVSFTVERGRCFGLVGESGSGKTTVGRMMVGLQTPNAGEVRVEGNRLSPRHRGQVQMVFQDPFASLNPRWTVGAIVAEPLHVLRRVRSSAEAAPRVAELLTAVGLSPADAARYPHAFSGGQRQRISIARALATEPAFLVCDEPTSALDVSVQAQVLNVIKDVQQARGMACLFISHNLAVVRHMSDEVGVMYLGHLVERAPVDALFERPRHPYTRLLLDAVPDLDFRPGEPEVPGAEIHQAAAVPPGCPFHPRCALATERCHVERPAFRPVGVTWVACHAVEEGRD